MRAWKVVPVFAGSAVAVKPGSRLIWVPAVKVICAVPLMVSGALAGPEAVMELVADIVLVPDDQVVVWAGFGNCASACAWQSVARGRNAAAHRVRRVRFMRCWVGAAMVGGPGGLLGPGGSGDRGRLGAGGAALDAGDPLLELAILLLQAGVACLGLDHVEGELLDFGEEFGLHFA